MSISPLRIKQARLKPHTDEKHGHDYIKLGFADVRENISTIDLKSFLKKKIDTKLGLSNRKNYRFWSLRQYKHQRTAGDKSLLNSAIATSTWLRKSFVCVINKQRSLQNYLNDKAGARDALRHSTHHNAHSQQRLFSLRRRGRQDRKVSNAYFLRSKIAIERARVKAAEWAKKCSFRERTRSSMLLSFDVDWPLKNINADDPKVKKNPEIIARRSRAAPPFPTSTQSLTTILETQESMMKLPTIPPTSSEVNSTIKKLIDKGPQIVIDPAANVILYPRGLRDLEAQDGDDIWDDVTCGDEGDSKSKLSLEARKRMVKTITPVDVPSFMLSMQKNKGGINNMSKGKNAKMKAVVSSIKQKSKTSNDENDDKGANEDQYFTEHLKYARVPINISNKGGLYKWIAADGFPANNLLSRIERSPTKVTDFTHLTPNQIRHAIGVLSPGLQKEFSRLLTQYAKRMQIHELIALHEVTAIDLRSHLPSYPLTSSAQASSVTAMKVPISALEFRDFRGGLAASMLQQNASTVLTTYPVQSASFPVIPRNTTAQNAQEVQIAQLHQQQLQDKKSDAVNNVNGKTDGLNEENISPLPKPSSTDNSVRLTSDLVSNPFTKKYKNNNIQDGLSNRNDRPEEQKKKNPYLVLLPPPPRLIEEEIERPIPLLSIVNKDNIRSSPLRSNHNLLSPSQRMKKLNEHLGEVGYGGTFNSVSILRLSPSMRQRAFEGVLATSTVVSPRELITNVATVDDEILATSRTYQTTGTKMTAHAVMANETPNRLPEGASERQSQSVRSVISRIQTAKRSASFLRKRNVIEDVFENESKLESQVETEDMKNSKTYIASSLTSPRTTRNNKSKDLLNNNDNHEFKANRSVSASSLRTRVNSPSIDQKRVSLRDNKDVKSLSVTKSAVYSDSDSDSCYQQHPSMPNRLSQVVNEKVGVGGVNLHGRRLGNNGGSLSSTLVRGGGKSTIKNVNTPNVPNNGKDNRIWDSSLLDDEEDITLDYLLSNTLEKVTKALEDADDLALRSALESKSSEVMNLMEMRNSSREASPNVQNALENALSDLIELQQDQSHLDSNLLLNSSIFNLTGMIFDNTLNSKIDSNSLTNRLQMGSSKKNPLDASLSFEVTHIDKSSEETKNLENNKKDKVLSTRFKHLNKDVDNDASTNIENDLQQINPKFANWGKKTGQNKNNETDVHESNDNNHVKSFPPARTGLCFPAQKLNQIVRSTSTPSVGITPSDLPRHLIQRAGAPSSGHLPSRSGSILMSQSNHNPNFLARSATQKMIQASSDLVKVFRRVETRRPAVVPCGSPFSFSLLRETAEQAHHGATVNSSTDSMGSELAPFGSLSAERSEIDISIAQRKSATLAKIKSTLMSRLDEEIIAQINCIVLKALLVLYPEHQSDIETNLNFITNKLPSTNSNNNNSNNPNLNSSLSSGGNNIQEQSQKEPNPLEKSISVPINALSITDGKSHEEQANTTTTTTSDALPLPIDRSLLSLVPSGCEIPVFPNAAVNSTVGALYSKLLSLNASLPKSRKLQDFQREANDATLNQFFSSNALRLQSAIFKGSNDSNQNTNHIKATTGSEDFTNGNDADLSEKVKSSGSLFSEMKSAQKEKLNQQKLKALSRAYIRQLGEEREEKAVLTLTHLRQAVQFAISEGDLRRKKKQGYNIDDSIIFDERKKVGKQHQQILKRSESAAPSAGPAISLYVPSSPSNRNDNMKNQGESTRSQINLNFTINTSSNSIPVSHAADMNFVADDEEKEALETLNWLHSDSLQDETDNKFVKKLAEKTSKKLDSLPTLFKDLTCSSSLPVDPLVRHLKQVPVNIDSRSSQSQGTNKAVEKQFISTSNSRFHFSPRPLVTPNLTGVDVCPPAPWFSALSVQQTAFMNPSTGEFFDTVYSNNCNYDDCDNGMDERCVSKVSRSESKTIMKSLSSREVKLDMTQIFFKDFMKTTKDRHHQEVKDFMSGRAPTVKLKKKTQFQKEFHSRSTENRSMNCHSLATEEQDVNINLPQELAVDVAPKVVFNNCNNNSVHQCSNVQNYQNTADNTTDEDGDSRMYDSSHVSNTFVMDLSNRSRRERDSSDISHVRTLPAVKKITSIDCFEHIAAQSAIVDENCAIIGARFGCSKLPETFKPKTLPLNYVVNNEIIQARNVFESFGDVSVRENSATHNVDMDSLSKINESMKCSTRNVIQKSNSVLPEKANPFQKPEVTSFGGDGVTIASIIENQQQQLEPNPFMNSTVMRKIQRIQSASTGSSSVAKNVLLLSKRHLSSRRKQNNDNTSIEYQDACDEQNMLNENAKNLVKDDSNNNSDNCLTRTIDTPVAFKLRPSGCILKPLNNEEQQQVDVQNSSAPMKYKYDKARTSNLEKRNSSWKSVPITPYASQSFQQSLFNSLSDKNLVAHGVISSQSKNKDGNVRENHFLSSSKSQHQSLFNLSSSIFENPVESSAFVHPRQTVLRPLPDSSVPAHSIAGQIVQSAIGSPLGSFASSVRNSKCKLNKVLNGKNF